MREEGKSILSFFALFLVLVTLDFFRLAQMPLFGRNGIALVATKAILGSFRFRFTFQAASHESHLQVGGPLTGCCKKYTPIRGISSDPNALVD